MRCFDRRSRGGAAGIFSFLAVFLALAGMACGEAVEMVNYYPAPSLNSSDEFERLHTDGVTVGSPYDLDNPADVDGTLRVAKWIQVGHNLNNAAEFVLTPRILTGDNHPRMKLGLNSLQFGPGLGAPDIVLLRPRSFFLRLRNYAGDLATGGATVFSVDGSRQFGKEATLRLHLGQEPNVSYMDVYNKKDSSVVEQYGLRIARKGTSTFRPLVIDFYDYNTRTVVAEGMRVLPDGRVGIGGVVPAQKLHVNGNGKMTGALYLGADSVDVAAKIAELEAEIEDLKNRVRALGG